MLSIIALLSGMTVGGYLLSQTSRTAQTAAAQAFACAAITVLGTAAIAAFLVAGMDALSGSYRNPIETALIGLMWISGTPVAPAFIAILFIGVYVILAGRTISLPRINEYDVVVYAVTGAFVLSLPFWENSPSLAWSIVGLIGGGSILFLILLLGVGAGRSLALPAYALGFIAETYLLGKLWFAPHDLLSFALIGAAIMPLGIKIMALITPHAIGEGYAHAHDAIDAIMRFERRGIPVPLLVVAALAWGLAFVGAIFDWHSVSPLLLVSGALISATAIATYQPYKEPPSTPDVDW